MLVTAGFGFLAIKTMLGVSNTEALYFGAIVSLSSTMVVLKSLSSQGTSSMLASRVMIALLVVQDLAVIPMLIVLPQLGDLAQAAPRLARSIAIAAVFLLGTIVAGTRVLPALLRRVLVWGSRELFLIAVVAAGVGVGYATYRLGLSFALGAFVAGLVLSETELSHQALSDVVPLRDVFGLVFFVSVGMLFDPRYLGAHAPQVAFMVASIIVGKALICGLLTRAFGFVNMAPWIVGLGLSQIGEFSFVLARNGLTGGILSQNTYDLVITCSVLSMAASPLVFAAAFPLGRAWARTRKPMPATQLIELPGPALTDHVIVAGGGRTGQAIATALDAASVPFVVIDLHHGALARPLQKRWPAIWGDITSEEVLRGAGVPRARIFVLTVPDWNAARLSIQRARIMNPTLLVVARATSERHVNDLRALGVEGAVQPEFEGGVEMVRQALRHYRHEDAAIDQLTERLRRELYGQEPTAK